MIAKLTLLDRYRLSLYMSYAELARRIGLDVNVLKRAIQGKHKMHDYNEIRIDQFIAANAAEIESLTGEQMPEEVNQP